MTIYIYDAIRTMQRIATAVAKGRDKFAVGFIRYDKAEVFVAKLQARYGSNPSPSAARAQRRAALAGSTLILLPRPERMGFDWWLLVGPGTGPVTTQERLQDARSREQRVHLGLFELARLPAPNGERRVQWTWRLPAKAYAELEIHAVALATHTSVRQAQALVDRMTAWPGWRGVAEQRREIWRGMRKARALAGRDDALSFPVATPWPTRMRLRGKGTPLAVAVESMRVAATRPSELGLAAGGEIIS